MGGTILSRFNSQLGSNRESQIDSTVTTVSYAHHDIFVLKSS